MITYGQHALDMLRERGIEQGWVERTIAAPDFVEQDPTHADRIRAFRAVPEATAGCSVWYMSRGDPPCGGGFLGSIEGSPAMRLQHDAEADAIYVRFTEATVAESEEVRPGVVLDFDADGRIVAIELLDASQHIAHGADLTRLTAA
jgi:uncharacterized protein YuzE